MERSRRGFDASERGGRGGRKAACGECSGGDVGGVGCVCCGAGSQPSDVRSGGLAEGRGAGYIYAGLEIVERSRRGFDASERGGRGGRKAACGECSGGDVGGVGCVGRSGGREGDATRFGDGYRAGRGVERAVSGDRKPAEGAAIVVLDLTGRASNRPGSNLAVEIGEIRLRLLERYSQRIARAGIRRGPGIDILLCHGPSMSKGGRASVNGGGSGGSTKVRSCGLGTSRQVWHTQKPVAMRFCPDQRDCMLKSSLL